MKDLLIDIFKFNIWSGRIIISEVSREVRIQALGRRWRRLQLLQDCIKDLLVSL
jgi:hypothetical protein